MNKELLAVGEAPAKATCAYCGKPALPVVASEMVAVELVWQHVQTEHQRFVDRGSAAISLSATPTDREDVFAYMDAQSNESAVYVQRSVGA